jgi:hypothetical protein
MADCRSPQEDRAIHHGCRPFEKRSGTRVPARSRTSSTRTYEGSIGVGRRRERLALQKTERRVRRCGLVRKWRGTGRRVRVGAAGERWKRSPGMGGLLRQHGNTGSLSPRRRGRRRRPRKKACVRRCRTRLLKLIEGAIAHEASARDLLEDDSQPCTCRYDRYKMCCTTMVVLRCIKSCFELVIRFNLFSIIVLISIK